MNEFAVVCMDSYAGRVEKPCRVVGETPKRYYIEVDVPTSLPPNFSVLLPGIRKLVPKRAIRFLTKKADIVKAKAKIYAHGIHDPVRFYGFEVGTPFTDDSGKWYCDIYFRRLIGPACVRRYEA